MKKRLQVILLPEAWSMVDVLTTEANTNFDVGSINYSDVINEMILSAKVDVKTLQRKHTDLRRSLRAIAAQESLDLDLAIKGLLELKAFNGRKKQAAQQEEVSA